MESSEYEHYQMQDALQQSQSESQNVPYYPEIQRQVQEQQAVLVQQTNPRKIVQDIILRLRGLDKKPNGDYIKIAEAKVNKIGQDNLWFILDSHINQGVILSHLKEDEIIKMMMVLRDDLVDDLSLNWREYGIKKKTDLDTITNSILFNVFLALKRAEGQNEKNWLGRISVENISGGPRIPPQRKNSWLDKFRL